MSLRQRIPAILLSRVSKLRELRWDDQVQALLGAEYGTRYLARLHRLAGVHASPLYTRRQNACALEASPSGNGLSQGAWNGDSSSWIRSPPSFWSGRDYVTAAQLRFNALPTLGIPSVPVELRRCRAGCQRVESLSHVLQRCPATHWSRIKRHDRVAEILARAAERKGFTVTREPVIPTTAGAKKPDLLLQKGDEVIVADVAIHWEGPSPLAAAAEIKRRTYSGAEFVASVRARYGVEEVRVLPFIMGARGTWCAENVPLATAIHLNARDRHTITADTLKGSWSIHRDFMRRVWRSRQRPHNN